MGQTVMSQIQLFNKRLKSKKYMKLGRNFYKLLQRIFTIFLINFWKPKYIRVLIWNFYQILERTIYKILERTIWVKLHVPWSNLLGILEKFNSEFYLTYQKTWPNFSKRTVWVNLYCSWFSNSVWNKIKNTNFCKESLNKHYGSDCINFWSEFAESIGK